MHIQSRINQLFDAMDAAAAGGSLDGMAPTVDVFETPDALVAEFEVPGVDPQSLRLRIHQGNLVLEGAKPRPKPPEGRQRDQFLCAERTFGSFVRSIPILCAVNGREVQAVLSRGVLRVWMPRVAERRGTTIDIGVKVEEASAGTEQVPAESRERGGEKRRQKGRL